MRELTTDLAAALASGEILPFFMATLQFKTSVQRVWTGLGNLTVDGQTFAGIGTLGEIGTITEGTNLEARGTYVKLSGIDPVLLGESLTDVQPGLTALLWLGCMDTNGNVIGTPYQVFSGIIDQPSIEVSDETISITLNLESKVIDFQRASQRKYTSADQRAMTHPNDSFFDYVEQMNDVALKPWS
jgi:hypothetical protein